MHYKYQVTDLRSCCTGVIEESRVWQLCLVFFLRLIFRIVLIVSLIPAFLLQSVLTSKLYDSKIFKNFQKFSAPISHFFLQRRAGHVIVEMSLINLDSCRGFTGAQHMANRLGYLSSASGRFSEIRCTDIGFSPPFQALQPNNAEQAESVPSVPVGTGGEHATRPNNVSGTGWDGDRSWIP